MEKRLRYGFTLIETIIFIVIVAIILPAFAVGSYNLLIFSVRADFDATALTLAEGRLEELSGYRFSQVSSESSTSFPIPFNQYSSSVEVFYVNGPSSLETAAGLPTDYKRIWVYISSSQNILKMGGLITKNDY